MSWLLIAVAGVGIGFTLGWVAPVAAAAALVCATAFLAASLWVSTWALR